jgi:hypothetical protein
MELKNQYRHQPLPPLKTCDKDLYIRLLKLYSGDREGSITCSLIQTRLSQAEPYEALSYCWGDSQQTGTVHITPETSSALSAVRQPLQVPGSLIPFLYRTRAHPLFKDEARLLWIDSICINQNDNDEKNVQVANMREIYVRAEHTLIWLGTEADQSSEALKYASMLARKWLFQQAEEQKRTLLPEEKKEREKLSRVKVTIGDSNLEALFALLDRPYFERTWIIQEAVVSKTAHVVVGDSSQTWFTFIWAFLYLLNTHSWIWEFYPYNRIALLFSLRISQIEWENRAPVQWWSILGRHRASKSGNPRDKVFALWGLGCKEQLAGMGIKPEYRESVEKVYWALAAKALEKEQVILFNVPRISIDEKDREAGMKELAIPSWVPDWRYTEDTPLSLTQFEVGHMGNPPSFQASAESKLPYPFNNSESGSKFPKTLRLRGYTIAQVTDITPRPWKLLVHPRRQTIRSQAYVLQFNQQQIVEWEAVILVPNNRSRIYQSTGETYFDALYRTLVAGTLPEGAEMAGRIAYEAFESRQRFLRVITNVGLGRFLWMYILVIIIERFLHLAFGYQNPEWNFRSIIPSMANRKGARLIEEIEEDVSLEEKRKSMVEYLGLVPGLTRLGDEVVLCEGVNVPLVLRRKELGDKKGLVYEFIGDTYVHGVMEGKLWDQAKCKDLHII